MYAIVEAGGRQWNVTPGTRLEINRVPTAVGAAHTVERVLLVHDGTTLQVGRPYVEGAKVVCEVVAHRQGPKTISYHFRRRENWRNTKGHRQPLTRLVVKDIVCGAAASSGASAVVVEAPRAPKKQSVVKAAPGGRPSPKPPKKPTAHKPASKGGATKESTHGT